MFSASCIVSQHEGLLPCPSTSRFIAIAAVIPRLVGVQSAVELHLSSALLLYLSSTLVLHLSSALLLHRLRHAWRRCKRVYLRGLTEVGLWTPSLVPHKHDCGVLLL